MPDMLLEVEGLIAGHGDAVVLEDVSFTLARGQAMALLGRNGMGKTTLLATLMGLTRVHGGAMRFAGRDLSAMPTHRRALAGLGWVPQEREIFPSLTVEENLTAVAVGGRWTLDRVWTMFPRLKERRANMGGQLSGGEQQMLAIARALMLDPVLLLLDEPMEGLAPLIVQELFRIIRRMTETGDLAVILVEQHAHQILPLTDRALVLERGRAVYSGDSRTLIDDPQRLDGWLGVTGGGPRGGTTAARVARGEA
ncbi:ABC transporter ATP-binding protein [Rhodoplanes sp. TEM]|uniref:ABC transporter ATP-binding protein n=1 Tax=Rhodoplanes tepidamans TaxID=200616 RepID=A0ABT5J354_RHOTP|nr:MULTISPECIES: ABC transporter ATP-binding protein [Rhodoplanes]MDC7784088.1 ABC transporter ATP-binding protein [Rhodoplanes tepidamans]MDC7983183.1 ABC transporter ATP-binding protein [Rhodoplanes sp. TEM]MDQ0356815.1 branched-chain amino acid transport system ATP-binding protein [Rhodoplanes tepidamans]